MKNVWSQLKKKKRLILIQAPMDGVTDVVFREIISMAGKPDLFFTEFTNVEGLCSKGYQAVVERLQKTRNQRPIIAQIWGLKPENYFRSGKIIKKLGFDGIDINMGCPVRDIVKTGTCSALINNPQLAGKIIESTIKGSGGLPVSVKTRLGVKKYQTEEWVRFLLSYNLAAIILHGRTALEMSSPHANWEEIGKAVQIRNNMKSPTLIIGNGDIKTREEVYEKAKTYRVDGVMIGRGMFTNLWIFNKVVDPSSISVAKRLDLLIRHLQMFDEKDTIRKDFNSMKKFYKVYINSFEEANNFRLELMECADARQAIERITEDLVKFA